MLKAYRYVKVHGLLKIKGCPKYGLIKKFKMDLMKVGREKDSKFNKYSIFILYKHNFVLSVHF